MVNGVGTVEAKEKETTLYYQQGNERYLEDESLLLDLSRNSLSFASTGEAVPGAVPKRKGKKELY